jgi:BTB/POZ domain-containing protein KCTD9
MTTASRIPKTYEESCRVLRSKGLMDEPFPPLADRMPAYDDEEPHGLSIFRTHLMEEDLSGLTLPRTFFGRSLVARCLWVNTDLSESCLCWNDFERCDFSGAALRGADLRASNFEDCSFDAADLSRADLRGSSFTGQCSFIGATVEGMRVTLRQLARLSLSAKQRESVSVEEEGEMPPGG